MTKYAQWQQLASYSAQWDRQLPAALWPVPGRLNGLQVTVGTGRVVNIAAGQFVVPLGAGQGSVLCTSDAADTATFAAAPPSGSNRIDLLCLQVRDATLDAGSNNDWIFSVVQGTPAASPVAPAVPARAAVLAQVLSVGAQANLAQGNITPQNERLLGALLAANVPVTPANTFVTVITTPVLQPGLWQFKCDLLGQAVAAGAMFTSTTIAGGGSGAIFGVPTTDTEYTVAYTSPGGQQQSHTDVTVRIDTPGTIQVQAMFTSAGGGTVGATQSGTGFGSVSGWSCRAVG